jgi:hypothetical protein
MKLLFRSLMAWQRIFFPLCGKLAPPHIIFTKWISDMMRVFFSAFNNFVVFGSTVYKQHLAT